MSRLDLARYAAETWVVDLPEHQGGMTIIVAHAGQALNRDPKFLKEQFGLDTEKGFRQDMIIPLSQSRQRPLTAAEKAAERSSEPVSVAPTPKTAREAQLEVDGAEKDRLLADLQAQVDALTAPAPAKSKSAAG